MKNKKTVLITGGAGFIGSHLCEKLLNQGNRVFCLDNLYTGSKNNIKEFLKNKDFIFIKQSVTKPIKINEKIDEIYNLACPASPVHYQKDPVETVRTNVLGAINVLELARKNKVKVFQASTSEVYGDPLEHPQKESYWGNVHQLSIRACYDEGKRCAETLFMDYHRQYGVDIAIMRIHNTHGPKMAQDDGRVISNFIIQALKNQSLTVYGQGKQTRSFLYVDDLIEAIIKLMNKKNFIGPVNIGNFDEMTVIDLAKKIIKLTNSKSKIIYNPLPNEDPQRRRPDISLAKEVLKWEPKIDSEQGFKKTIEYFRRII
ncbi:MAG: UDP-glucuronic acid decarboxylase family protein [bacterium]